MITRRKIVATVGSTAIVSVAGCATGSGGDDQDVTTTEDQNMQTEEPTGEAQIGVVMRLDGKAIGVDQEVVKRGIPGDATEEEGREIIQNATNHVVGKYIDSGAFDDYNLDVTDYNLTDVVVNGKPQDLVNMLQGEDSVDSILDGGRSIDINADKDVYSSNEEEIVIILNQSVDPYGVSNEINDILNKAENGELTFENATQKINDLQSQFITDAQSDLAKYTSKYDLSMTEEYEEEDEIGFVVFGRPVGMFAMLADNAVSKLILS